MQRTLFALLALAAALPGAAHAQVRFVLPSAPGTPVLLAPVFGPAATLVPTLAPIAGAPVGLSALGTPLQLAPVQGLATANQAVARPVLQAGTPVSKAAAASQAGGKVTSQALLKSVASAVTPRGRSASSNETLGNLRRTFDAGALAAAEPDGVSWFGGNLDPRIARAVQTLSRSAVGLSIYQEVYRSFGATLKLKVDSDRNATYDSRLRWEGETPVLEVTEALMSRESDEFAAAMIAREMAHLYYHSFPVSAEREYLAHAAMAQSFAELTNSGQNNRWDSRRDRYDNGRYVMQSHYASWKESLQLLRDRRQPVQDSTYFRWLQSEKSRQTLQDLEARDAISWSTYTQMKSYFEQMTQSETDWLSNTGRWWSQP